MKRRNLFLSVLVALGLTVGGMAVYASIPDSSGIIHGCYAHSGALRVVDSATAACSSKETALNWNQQGPQGPAGAQGPQGPQGAQGSPGVSGYEVVSATFYPDPGIEVIEPCPAGKKVLGGGARSGLGNNSQLLADSHPTPSNDGWAAAWGGSPGNASPITVYAICAVVQG